MAVWPPFATEQVSTDGVGDVVAAPPEQDSDNAAGVKAGAATTSVMAREEALPVLGVATSVPL